MENYEILNPEKAPLWALSRTGSVLKACERAKELDIFDRLLSSETSAVTGVRNEPTKIWGTNIAVCVQIRQEPEWVN